MENEVMDPVMVVDDLSVSFSGKKVLDGVSLEVFPGELTLIVGPSGSGKTTLLRAMNRLNELFPDCSTSGTVRLRLDGLSHDLYEGRLPLPDVRRKVGMVFQTPAVLPFSVKKNLTMPLKVAMGRTGAEAAARMEWALREVTLWDEVKDRLDAHAATLSGGQQQRLCLARALALEPHVLLLDEPSASLDFKATEQIESLLLRLKNQVTIVAVSHSLSQVRRLADRLYVLREGRLVGMFLRDQLLQRDVFDNLLEELF
jgi:phosphate transport system ATP-binding protein